MDDKKIRKIIEWYLEKRPLYKSLAEKVADIIKDSLEQRGINFHLIENRAKEIDSFKNKISNLNIDPKEIQDLAGIRIITYIESEAKKVCNILKEIFEIDKERSSDKSKSLGVNKVGYRSIHYVASFPKNRIELPEFQKFGGLFFEIQIRSILQNAWAEIQHKKNYKFTGILPEEIQRKISILSGLLEIADKEFDEASKDIDNYSKKVSESAKEGNLDISINTTSLRQYMLSKFEDVKHINPVFGKDNSGAKEIVEELKGMGLKTLADIEKIIPKNFMDEIKKFKEDRNNFIGVLRDILIIHDSEKYFGKIWKRKWSATGFETVTFLAKFNINMVELGKKYRIDTFFMDED